MTTDVSQGDRLRAAAGILDPHPHLPVPCIFAYSTGKVDVTWQILHDDPATQLATMIAIRRAIGGRWEKHPWGSRFDIRQRINDWLTVEVYAQREAVCEARVVGTETVTLPPVEAQPERTVERDVIEWDCDSWLPLADLTFEGTDPPSPAESASTSVGSAAGTT